MKRILRIAMVLGLGCALTVMAQEVKLGKVDVVDFGGGVKLEMVLVPAGKFKMGCTKKESKELGDLQVAAIKELLKEIKKEKEPKKDSIEAFAKIIKDIEAGVIELGESHEVTLTKAYYMGRYEVTQEQWEKVMGDNPSDTKGAKLPVTNVSWNDCQDFIKKLNAKTDGGYRLPTESEWEYACRAGTTTVYSFGDKITLKDANYSDSKIGKPVPVGSYKANAFGLHDMHGNVIEWCDDWVGEYPFAVTDPKGPATGDARVLRGGSFNDSASVVRSSHRSDRSPPFRDLLYGFRLARTP